MDKETLLQDTLKKIERTQKLLNKHSATIKLLKQKLVDNCDHSQTEVTDTYFEGSYFDRASTTKTTKCTICGTTLKIEDIVHGWYG
jgi:hypothetical protein